jgi:hypothetical protein
MVRGRVFPRFVGDAEIAGIAAIAALQVLYDDGGVRTARSR